ncbi:MAG: metal-dependent hydrolase [Flammeovirgaceae bacterium]
MDSLTQIVLGASVGEAVCGKKIGNKAMVVGAIAGTIPDLDVLARPFQDMVQYLYYHRSITHSLLFAFVLSPVFAWLTDKLLKDKRVSVKEWTWLFFLGFTTHAALDCFTTWGTKVFYPFSAHPIAFHSIFVIDPLYTIPFIIFLLLSAFTRITNPMRTYYNQLGLIFSTVYLLVTLINKGIANKIFEKNLEAKGLTYQSYISKPTPFNSILWTATAKTETGYYSGFHSLLDNDHLVDYRFLPANHDLLNDYLMHPKVKQLIEVTQGYYAVEKADKGVYINDLRFGEFKGWGEQGRVFVFKYHIWKEGDELKMDQINFRPANVWEYLIPYWERLKGNKQTAMTQD